ncbi:MAG: hypothetical protein HY961_01025 [Ignavibacteriae bacterium]|nr:hypothetical protein [Ignavibacteriota bacterium]
MKKDIILLITLYVLCLPSARAGGTRVILFDKAHGELFSPSGSHPLDYSIFASLFKSAGYMVRTQNEAITAKSLDGVSVLVMSGAFKELTRFEIGVIVNYIRTGGNVLLLLHVSAPVARLTEQFGIIVSNATVYETEQGSQFDGKPYNFLISRFHPHPIFSGVKAMAVFGSWALLCEGNVAHILATTSSKAFADVTQNNRFDPQDPIQAFGVVASAEKHAGKLLVIADDAAFSNAFIEEADNIRVGRNIVEWLTVASKR